DAPMAHTTSKATTTPFGPLAVESTDCFCIQHFLSLNIQKTPAHVQTSFSSIARSHYRRPGGQLVERRSARLTGIDGGARTDCPGTGGSTGPSPCVGSSVQSGPYRKTTSYAGSSRC